MFASIEICYLNRHKYQFDEIEPIYRSTCQKQLYDSLDRSMSIDGIEALERFSGFCRSMGKPSFKDDDFKKKADRTMKYALLFGTLFFRNATEKEEHLKKRVLQALQSLVPLFGIPSEKYLEDELSPLSERYDYAFRYMQVKNFIDKLQ